MKTLAELLDDPLGPEDADPEYWTSELPDPLAIGQSSIQFEEGVFDDGRTSEPCPACGKMMRWRLQGWRRFLGCEAFPRCRWTSYAGAAS